MARADGAVSVSAFGAGRSHDEGEVPWPDTADAGISAVRPVREVAPMLWVVVSNAGLVVETSLIVVLGLRVTGPHEEATNGGHLLRGATP
jgi:hypothetical protein